MTASDAIAWLLTKPKDLPVFVLIGTDPIATRTVRFWAEQALDAGVNNGKVLEAFKCSSTIEEWPDKKLPG